MPYMTTTTKRYFTVAMAALAAMQALLLSCMDEKFSSDPTHLLSFSADTISFDTLFTGVGSATKTLMIYNHNESSLMFSAALANKSNSGFRLNIDGRNDSGENEFTGLTIRSGDSIYVFIEITANEQGDNSIGLIKDSIVFVTNGTQQDVKLIAYGQDATTLYAPTITSDTTFTADLPIIIHDSLVVAQGATLTCEAGTSLYFHGTAGCTVHGTLVVRGEAGNEVMFRGDRTDKLFSYLPYDRVPGQWGGITFSSGSYGNVMEYADVHGGSYAIKCDSADVTREKIRIIGCKLSNTTGNVLEMTDCKAEIANTEISNSGESCVDLTGGDVRFTHCTLANYYSYGLKLGVALSLRNTANGIAHPVIQAAFRNCIIAGSSSDEISGSVSDDATIDYNYSFSNSLVNSVEPDGGDVENCLWVKDDNFRLIDSSTFTYDFHLDSLSQARDLGATQWAEEYPLDRDGNPRTAALGGDGMPDAGCYEWQAGK